MKIIAVIPARYASTRFPAKLMQDLGGKTVIRRTYEAALATQLFDDVFVVTDSDIIFQEIVSNGGKAIKSVKEHESGSDRIAEAIEHLEVDIVVNVQGDEPFIDADPLQKAIEVFKNDLTKQVDLASVMREITNEDDINNPNNVKVVVDKNGFALYFSRSVIPYPREKNVGVRYFQHIGIYAFRKQSLLDFYSCLLYTSDAADD
jgi:3-deoxy-manno-octulosonate cytidylyltransferase (CMP-KDO synthetase)